LDTSAFDPLEPDAVEGLLIRTKQRSAELRRHPTMLLFDAVGWRRNSGRRRRMGLPAAGPPRRFSPSTMALASVGVVVALVVALVVVDATSGDPGAKLPVGRQPMAGGVPGPVDVPTPVSVLDAVTGVTPQVANAVGVPPTSVVAPPTVQTGQPALVIGGRPGAVFIGGEFCPYCGAERWAIVMAFSRFGTFTNLSDTDSSPWDIDPSTPTFSFYRSSYTSSSVALAAVEHVGNDTTGLDTRRPLQPLTAREAKVWQTYDHSSGYPFLDIGNAVFAMGPSFDPSVLAGLDQADVAARLTNPDDPATRAIVGTANYLTAAICHVLGPTATSSWCTEPAVTQAAAALGLG